MNKMKLHVNLTEIQSLLCICASHFITEISEKHRDTTNDVNKDFSHKDQDQDKDLWIKDQDKNKDFKKFIVKDKDQDLTVKDKDKNSALVLKESLRTMTKTRTNITGYRHQDTD